MKQDLRMNAKSPDPDDLATDELPVSKDREPDGAKRRDADEPGLDRSAPHVPPIEKGRIRGN
jgi:hypothetical protein